MYHQEPLILTNQLSTRDPFVVVVVVFKDFIYLFERQRSQVGTEAGRERERRKQAPC